MTLLVEHTALMMTVQDSGRYGYRRFGMPVSGPMDWWAYRCANRLVGNPLNAACLEAGYSSACFTAKENVILAVCGAGYEVSVNDRSIPLWMSFWVNRGDEILLRKINGGQWVYLAVQGGIGSSKWMGSRSEYHRAGLGTRMIAGDRIDIDRRILPNRAEAGRRIPDRMRPGYSNEPVLRAVPGPHEEWFKAESLTAFFNQPFSLSTKVDRMGYRLIGQKINRKINADLVSQGLVIGEVQIPPDGQPIVMMADHPTTGGYPCIATIIKADLPHLAQSQPGKSIIHFKPIDVSEAQEALRLLIHQLDSGIIDEEDDLWLQL